MTLLPHLEFYLRPLPGYAILQPVIESLALRQWNRSHRPPAPRCVKAEIIRGFAASDDRRIFVETGSFFGDMLAAVRNDFERLYSIELHPGLARRAMKRFVGDPKISIQAGDSSNALEPLLRSIRQPAVLWLDGHYSGLLTARGEVETPILRELDGALRGGTNQDAILIDDARLFGVNPAYPPIAEIEHRVSVARPEWVIRVDHDIIQISQADPK